MAPAFTEDEIDDLLYYARAGESGDLVALRDELCKREDVDFSELVRIAKDDHSGNGILHMAAANGHTSQLSIFDGCYLAVLTDGAGIVTDIIKLLSQPVPQSPTMLALMNGQNTAGNTPLHWAALNGHLECVKVLLDNGADPTITNKAGHDPVYEAELNDKKDVVEWVLKESESLEEGIGGGEGGDEEGDAPDESMESEDEDEGEASGASGTLANAADTLKAAMGSMGLGGDNAKAS